MKNIFILIFLNCFFSYSQKKTILDFETKKPISFSTISYKLSNNVINGLYTEYNGEFNLETVQVFDSLVIECLGYKKRSIHINNLKGKDTLFLKVEITPIKEVIVTNKKPTAIGYINKKKLVYTGIGKGLEEIVFIENKSNKNLFIKSFLFKVNKIKTKVGYRIHLYKKSDKAIFPDEEITNQNKIYFLEKGTKGLVEVDLSDLGLEIPVEGIFIGMEALGEFNDKTNVFLPFEKDKISAFLNFQVYKSDKSLTFIRNVLYKNGWGNHCKWQKEDYMRTFNKNLDHCTTPCFGLNVIE